MADTFWKNRLAKVEEQIAIYDDAISAIVSGGSQSYTLDTGQSRQTVTKFDLKDLQSALTGLENKRSEYYIRCNGGNTIQGRVI